MFLDYGDLRRISRVWVIEILYWENGDLDNKNLYWENWFLDSGDLYLKNEDLDDRNYFWEKNDLIVGERRYIQTPPGCWKVNQTPPTPQTKKNKNSFHSF